MRLPGAVSIALAAVSAVFIACGPEKPPPRDYFTVLRQQLTDLQAAVVEKDTTAIDSLVIPTLRKDHRGADSLLHFIYGPTSTFAFEQFGNYQVVYSHDRARIDCYIMDSSGQEDRPVTLTFELQKDKWLLRRWGPTTEPMTTPDVPR